MLRRAAPVSLFLIAIAPLLAERARAYETWCFDDPLISVGGRLVDIQVQIPVGNLATMRATTLTVVIPRNVSGGVLVDDISAFPMTTTISRTGPSWNGLGGLPITVVVDVLAGETYPIRAVATPLLALGTPLADATVAYGYANTTLTMPVLLVPDQATSWFRVRWGSGSQA